jgi:hypothetical protein
MGPRSPQDQQAHLAIVTPANASHLKLELLCIEDWSLYVIVWSLMTIGRALVYRTMDHVRPEELLDEHSG